MALRAHFDTASGLHGPRPIVTFRFFIYTDSQDSFVGLSHQVLVHAMVNDASVPIGPAYLPGSHRFDRASGTTGPKVNLVLPIDFATLRWIEDQRAGRGGVTFYFDWSALGNDEARDGGPQPLQNEPVSLAIGGTPFPVQLPQETWLTILHDVRYREVAVVEIPLTEDPQNVLARSHEHLETARERLYRADDRGVLVACGEALDVLANARQVKLSKEYGYDDLIEDLTAPIFDSDRKAERLGKVLSGVRQMCLSGKHDEAGLEGRPIPVDHHDAVMAFLMTAAAISYLEQLPLELTVNDRHGIGGRPRTRRRSRGRSRGGLAEALPALAVSGAPVETRSTPLPEPRPQPLPLRPAEGEAAPPTEGTGQPSRRRRGRRSRGGSGTQPPNGDGAPAPESPAQSSGESRGLPQEQGLPASGAAHTEPVVLTPNLIASDPNAMSSVPEPGVTSGAATTEPARRRRGSRRPRSSANPDNGSAQPEPGSAQPATGEPAASGARPAVGEGASTGVRPAGSETASSGLRPAGGENASSGLRPAGGENASSGLRPAGSETASSGAQPTGGENASSGARPASGEGARAADEGARPGEAVGEAHGLTRGEPSGPAAPRPVRRRRPRAAATPGEGAGPSKPAA